MKAKIIEEKKRILKRYEEELKQKYSIKRFGIFGSYIRGEQKEESDFDLLVEFEGDDCIGLLKFINLENFLSDLLGLKVDLVDKSSLKPRIGKQILKEVVYI